MAAFELHIIPHDKLDPREWDAFIKNSPQGGIYALHGYASAIAGDWQAVIVQKSGEWLAVMPFVSRRKWGLTYSLQPLFSQYWGVFFAPMEGTDYKRLSQQGKCLETLLPALAPFRLIRYRLSPQFEYLLPFYWKGFKMNPRFTYILGLGDSEEKLWKGLASPLQRQIKKGRKAHVQVQEVDELAPLLKLIRQQQASGHDILAGAKNAESMLRKVFSYLQASSGGKVIILRDEAGETLAAGLFAYFSTTCVYLIGAYDPEKRDTGAMSLLMWEAILKAKEKGCLSFDFEGSMVANIEGFFRKFGARPQTYFEISKNTLPLPLRWMEK